MDPSWQSDLNDLQTAGFSDKEIEQERSHRYSDLTTAGFSDKEAKDYFGIKEPDMSRIKSYFVENLDSHRAQMMEKKNDQTQGQQEPLSTWDTIKADWKIGIDSSSTGMAVHGKEPDQLLSEDAPRAYKLLRDAGTMVGDIPAMLAGGMIGAPAGLVAGFASPIPGGAVAGTAAGMLAGANALPTAIREILVDHYRNGEFKNFGDFWDRSSSILLDTLKSGAAGAVGGAAGHYVGLFAPAVAKPLAQGLAEVGTMVTAGKALEGQVPSFDEFMNGAILVGGFHGISHIPGKLYDIYAKTGIKPDQVAKEAIQDPLIKQDLLAQNKQIPRAYEGQIDPNIKQQLELDAQIPKDSPLLKVNPALGDQGEPAMAASEKVASRIVDKKPKPSEPYSMERFKEDAVDRFDPIKRLAEQAEVSPSENPYFKLRTLGAARSKFMAAVSDNKNAGTFDFNNPLKRTGDSLGQILAPVKDDYKDLVNYGVAMHSIELEKQGIRTGVDQEAAKEVVQADKQKYDKMARSLSDYSTRLKRYAADAGLISHEAVDRAKVKYDYYFPFKRASEGDVSKGSSKSAPVMMKIKGSELKIVNPIQEMFDQTQSIIERAERNAAIGSLVKMSADADEPFLKKVPTQFKKIKISEAEIAKFHEEHGINADPATMEIYRPEKVQAREDQLVHYVDGKPQLYEATTPELGRVIKSLNEDPLASNIAAKFLKTAADVERTMTVLRPAFLVRHTLRNQVMAFVNSEHGTIPFLHMIQAIPNVIGKDEVYWNWLKSGGGNGAFSEVDTYFDKKLDLVDKETGLTAKTWNVIRTPFDAIHAATQILEDATRVAEFKNATGGGNPRTLDELMYGAMKSRDVTPDALRKGAKAAFANSIIPFFNMNVQGLDQVKDILSDPGKAKRAAALITTASVLAFITNKDDERMNDIADIEKESNWIIPTDWWQDVDGNKIPPNTPKYLLRENNGRIQINNGIMVKIPKPFEAGQIFGTLPEHLMKAFFTDHPAQWGEFVASLSHALPSMIPAGAAPIIELATNKKASSLIGEMGGVHGSSIVPEPLMGVMPAYRYTEYTSDTAKQLGKLIASLPGGKNLPIASPMQIENIISTWTGPTGKFILNLLDKVKDVGVYAGDKATGKEYQGNPIIPDRASFTTNDIPFLSSFVARYPSAHMQPINDFYGKYEERQRMLATFSHLKAIHDFEGAMAFRSSVPPEDFYSGLANAKAAMSKQMQFIQEVNRNKKFSAGDKQALIWGTYYQMNEIAKQQNKIMDELKKKSKGVKE